MYGKYGENNSNYNKIRQFYKIIYPDGREIMVLVNSVDTKN